MKPTDQLSDDHRQIELVLNILERMCEELDGGAAVDPAHLEQALDFIKLFADKCHHGKEENLLFPAMEKVGFSREQGPLAVMLADHTLGRKFVQELGAALARYKESKDASGILRPARNYIALLRDHIEKEDLVLFPMAAATISETRQRELLDEFQQVNDDILGTGKREGFQSMISTLKAFYHVKPV